MRIGIALANDTWHFFNEIYNDLKLHHTVNIFEPRQINLPVWQNRINRYLFHHDLEAFMKKNDVLFFEWASELLVAATQLPKRCPIIVRLHRYEMFSWANEVNWERVDRIILMSNAMQHKFAEKFPEHAHKTVVLPVGVSPKQFAPISKSFNGDIGTLCHISPRKRIYELLLTFYELIQTNANLHLHIGGGNQPRYNDYTDAINNAVKQLKLQDKITFYGAVTDANQWYKNIDIFISNSYSEGLQVALMEAMSTERFCLSHSWDGVQELLPGDNLFWTDSDLRQLILCYCDSSETDKHHRQKQMREIVVDRFNGDVFRDEIRHIVEEIV